MTFWSFVGGVVSIVLVVGFFGGLLYVTLFKAHLSNQPVATRGIGIVLLAGVLKVVLLVLAENVSEAFGDDWLNYPLIAVAAVGMFMMMSGLGGNN
ncbi:MAG TPA: hypothetical protein VF449_05640 [Parvibaculum sp.]